MKPLSIKVKITFWYTGLIVFILCVILGSIVFSTDKILVLGLQRELEDEVYDVVEDIQFKDGLLNLERIKYFDDGIHVSIYSEEQNQLAGQLPSGFPAGTPFRSEEVQTVQTDSSRWLVYDMYVTVKGPAPLWLRGVISQSSSYETRNQILLVCMVLFPFLVLLAGYGGWLITKSAFQPVSLIQRTAAEIQRSGDLSKRIHLTGSKDEIQELAQTFDAMLEQLEASFKAQCQFTSDASHELRTPVSVIMAHAEYGLSQKDHPEEMAEALQVIAQQAEQMNSLIRSLLFLARAGHHPEQPEFEMINLSEVAEMVVEEIAVSAKSRNITVYADIAPDICLLADQTLLMRLLLNLLQNAIRYGRDNGWVKLKLRRTDGKVAGSVEDNGIGIAREHIDKVWKRFYQADPSRRRADDSGAGLGLPMVKWIIERHGGKITLESRLGEGTAFYFQLPAAQSKRS